ncbi:VTT domain-containing protein [Fundidesulfovibrio agrisoli]|uniref:VTT domain-containing protein n=1 Tax=Fundidesulfovibrio agrisoli TaxID=2922717 RepID=UPI001FAB7CF7
MSPADAWETLMHLDGHLLALSREYGAWAYGLMFLVLFAETGLVVATALPSDTVLFAVGALAARGAAFNVWWTLALMGLAAFLGDSLNFAIGRFLGRRYLDGHRIPFVSDEALAQAHDYYERHGGVTVVAARFVPVLRSLAPLAGGMVGMGWREFLYYNAVGKLIWTPLYLFGGYFFGQIPWVRENFSVAIFFALGAPLMGVVARMLYVSVKKGL